MGTSVKVSVFMGALAWFVLGAPISAAENSPVGNWARDAEGGRPAMSMTIESWGIGNTRLSYGANEGVERRDRRRPASTAPIRR